MPQLTLYPPSAHVVFHGGNLIFSHEVEKAVHDIHAACRGIGTDEQLLTKALGNKSPETRNLIAVRYHQLHHKTLESLVKGEASGSYGKLLRMIATPLQETEARLLLDATKGSGTNETLCIQVLYVYRLHLSVYLNDDLFRFWPDEQMKRCRFCETRFSIKRERILVSL